MFAKHETEVLVVGAGPVGLMTALRLAKRGVQVEIVDKHWRTGAHSYALALHPESLRLLDELGILSNLMEVGRRVDRVSFWEGDRERCALSLSDLGGDFPFLLVLPQSHLEGALEKHLQENRVKVLWNHRLQEISDSDFSTEIAKLDRVACGYPIAQMEWMVVKTFRTKASFVVGADGYHSIVRDKLGIALEQLSEPDIFSVFEFESPTDPGSEVRVVLDERWTSVLWPMTNNRCRWSFQISNADRHEPTHEHLNALIKERAPWFPEVKGEIHWSSAVLFARRLTESFGRNWVWLAGDAAHLTGPVGVQSMNSGLIEGSDIGNRLADILRNNAPREILEEYGTEHLKEWRALLGLHGKPAPKADADDWVKHRAERILACAPATGNDLRRLLGQLHLELA